MVLERAVEFVTDISTRILNIVASIEPVDILDMLLMAFIIYKGIKIVKETKAVQLLSGIVIILLTYAISAALKLKMMTYLFGNFFQVGLIALIVVFQPELRRVLERVGRTNVATVFNRSDDMAEKWSQTIEAVSEAVSDLSDTATGALIVIERTNHLGVQIENGTFMDCVPSAAALKTIFFPKTALHDGAVIIRDARIIAAGCFLPTPAKEEYINKQLGSRHRAAIGMSEESDAIIIVVSEETGTVSVADTGELTRGYTRESLEKLLREKFLPDSGNEKNIIGIIKSGKEKLNGKRRKN